MKVVPYEDYTRLLQAYSEQEGLVNELKRKIELERMARHLAATDAQEGVSCYAC